MRGIWWAVVSGVFVVPSAPLAWGAGMRGRAPGRALGDPLCVSESGARDYSTMNTVRLSGNAPMSVAPGTEALTFAVDVVFALK